MRYTQEQNKLIDSIAKKHNLTRTCIMYRLQRNNYDFSKVDYPSKERRIKYYYNGQPAVDVAVANGIKKEVFTQRVRNGWSIEKACTYKQPSIKEISLKTGLTVKQVQNLVYNLKISKESLIKNYKK